MSASPTTDALRRIRAVVAAAIVSLAARDKVDFTGEAPPSFEAAEPHVQAAFLADDALDDAVRALDPGDLERLDTVLRVAPLFGKVRGIVVDPVSLTFSD